MPITVQTEHGTEPLEIPQGPQGDQQVPDFAETARETFRTLNPIASTLRLNEFEEKIEESAREVQGPPDPGFNLAEHIPSEHGRFVDFYVQYADTPEQAEIARDYIDSLLKSQQVVAEGGIFAKTIGTLGAAAADPLMLIPGTAAFNAVRFGRFGLRGRVAAQAVGSGALTGGGAAISQEILLRSQPTLTREESNFVVGSATLLGFIMGPVIANLSREAAIAAQHELKGVLRAGEETEKKYVLDAETGTISLNENSRRNRAKFTEEELENC